MTISHKEFRYNTEHDWFKGNTHIHSIASDGGKTIAEIAELYSSAQYDFIFCTDHRVASDFENDSENAPLLLLDGIELDGYDDSGGYFHVVCLGKTNGISMSDGFELAMKKAKDQNAIMILAHPRWSGNTPEDAIRWDFDGVEIYNHVCHWLNGKSDGFTYWDVMLKKEPNTLMFSVDDAHLTLNHPGWNGGWIVVNVPKLSKNSILSAIKRGNFYSSCGPEFKSIAYDGKSVIIKCNPAKYIRLVGPAYNGLHHGSFDGPLHTEVSFEIPEEWDHAYIEIEDKDGKQAWSNTLFVTT